ncbi:Ubiquinone biosynthesis monooxygenase COQ6, mitochondrial [Aphelenchoides besseyi]|nr:Ubiquinone biosynthesis monooxygenase COQ6, mitochondrial [Aphelenchoides besseyi]
MKATKAATSSLRQSRRFASSLGRQLYDVAIVGGGPVGNSMACALGHNKWLKDKRVVILESAKPQRLGSPPLKYSNRVFACSPASIQMFKGTFWIFFVKMVKEVEGLYVLDACSRSKVQFEPYFGANSVSHLIEDEAITKALHGRIIDHCKNVEIRAGVKVDECRLPSSLAETAQLKLSDGSEIDALLVGADGARSGIRRQMNVTSTNWDYGQMAIVCTLSVDSPGKNSIAWQRFTPLGPIALLPLTDQLSSLVWTSATQDAKRLLALPADQFVDELNHYLFTNAAQNPTTNQALGFMDQCARALRFTEKPNDLKQPPTVLKLHEDSRAAFPLAFNHAKTYVKTRTALIGSPVHFTKIYASVSNQTMKRVFVLLFVVFNSITLLVSESQTTTTDDVVTNGNRFGESQSLRQPHSLDDLLQREEWRDELVTLSLSRIAPETDTSKKKSNSEGDQSKDIYDTSTLAELFLPIQTAFTNIYMEPIEPLNNEDLELLNHVAERDDLDLAEFHGPYCSIADSATFRHRPRISSTINLSILRQFVSWGLLVGHEPERILRLAALYWWIEGSAAESIHCLQRLVVLTEDHEQRRNARFMIGQTFALCELFDLAIPALEVTAYDKPLLWGPHFVLAGVRAYTGDYDGALQDYKRYVQLYKMPSDGHRLMAIKMERKLQLQLLIQQKSSREREVINGFLTYNFLKHGSDLSEHQDLMKNYETHRESQESEYALEMEPFLENLKPYVGLRMDGPVNAVRYPKLKDFDLSAKRNIDKLCSSRSSSTISRNSTTIFIDLNSRGYPVGDLLNKYLGLTPLDVHPLPWDMPFCKPWSIEDEKSKLWAMEIGPRWLLVELAAMFWRASGMFNEALACIAENLYGAEPIHTANIDISLFQLVRMLIRARSVEGTASDVALLMKIAILNLHVSDPAVLCLAALTAPTTEQSLFYLWQAYEIDDEYAPAVLKLEEHYCKRKTFGRPIQDLYQPICCWQTEHDVYCFKRPDLEGSCFKIETKIVDDKVEHVFKSFRCSGTYVLPLDYGGFSYKRMAEYSQLNEINKLQTRIDEYVDPEYAKKNAERIERSKVENVKPKEKEDLPPLDHAEPLWHEVIRYDNPLPIALLSLGNPQDTVDTIGVRLSEAIKRFRKSKAIAALYFRVKGDAINAVMCLRHSLANAPNDMKEIAAISLANVYHQAGFLNSALLSADYALRASNETIVAVHFTLANIYTSLNNYELANRFYYSTIALQSNFQAAKDRITALHCIGIKFLEKFNHYCKGVQLPRELIVIGAGNMAGCMVSTFVEKALESAHRILLLAVKPQIRHELYVKLRMSGYVLKAEIVCSILAGVTHEMLTKEIEGIFIGPLIRLTPNVPSAVGSGVTLLYGPNENANDVATQLLRSTGEVIPISEKYFNCASAITGSGPAFVINRFTSISDTDLQAFLMIDALADGAVLNGIPRETATRMAALMLRGASDLILQSGKHPGQLKDQVCSPGGTTIVGIRELEKNGVRSGLIEAVNETTRRANHLSGS